MGLEYSFDRPPFSLGMLGFCPLTARVAVPYYLGMFTASSLREILSAHNCITGNQVVASDMQKVSIRIGDQFAHVPPLSYAEGEEVFIEGDLMILEKTKFLARTYYPISDIKSVQFSKR